MAGTTRLPGPPVRCHDGPVEHAPPPTLDSSGRPRAPSEDVLVRLLKLAAVISRPMQDGVAAPHGLSVNELRIVMCLSAQGPCAGHEITHMVGVAPMNVSRALASLSRRGWIEPAEDAANRRRKPVRLSAAGIAGYRALGKDLSGVADALVGPLDAAEAARLGALAEQVLASIARWSPPSDQPASTARRRP